MTSPHLKSPQSIRRIVLEQSKRAHIGHIGCALSIAELVGAVFAVLKVAALGDPDRDRFVLSKGHAALALYAALHLQGSLSREQLDSFCADGSLLGVHPERDLPGVDFSTGSLGHGLSMGVGAALAAKLQHSARRVYVLMSDGECNEGSVWEAAAFAAHHQLGNLTAMIDLNGQQALGYTRDVLNIPNMAERWRAFGWEVHEMDGHDGDGLAAKLAERTATSGAPRLIVAKTIFGKGVSFMENQIQWHYLPMSDAQFAEAVREIETA